MRSLFNATGSHICTLSVERGVTDVRAAATYYNLPFSHTSKVLESLHVSCITYLAVDVTSGRRWIPPQQKERVVVRPRRRDDGVGSGEKYSQASNASS